MKALNKDEGRREEKRRRVDKKINKKNKKSNVENIGGKKCTGTVRRESQHVSFGVSSEITGGPHISNHRCLGSP